MKATQQDNFDYSSFFNLAVDMFCIADSRGHFVKVNNAFSIALGYSEGELLNVPFISFVHPSDIEATLAEVAALNKGNKTLNFQNRYRCKDGSWKTLAWRSTPQPDGMVFAVARDITEQAEMEQLVRSSILRGQDVERERIAKEIHDGVCQSLVAIHLNFHILEPMDETKMVYYQTARNLIKNSIKEMRAYAHNLQPPELIDQTIQVAVKSLARRTEILSQVKIDFECNLPDGIEMVGEQKIHVYRIIQEFINNSLKHSNGTKIEISCQLISGRVIQIKLSDDGTGLPSDMNSTVRSGTGVANMLARIQLINGKYELETAPNKGLCMVIELHLPE